MILFSKTHEVIIRTAVIKSCHMIMGRTQLLCRPAVRILTMRWSYTCICRAYRRRSFRRCVTNPHVLIVTACLIGALVSLLVGTFTVPPMQVRLPAYVNRTRYKPYQSDVMEDFPTVVNGDAKIPHIIHQAWNSSCIHKDNVPYIRSFVRKNPGWEYYFWTDVSARDLILERHSGLLKHWESGLNDVQRRDIIKYVALYEFGGIYADIDMEDLRPLDRVTRKYSCIMPTEPLEHSILLYGLPYVISNSIMLCSPKHPILRQLLDALLETDVVKDNKPIEKGPLYTNPLKTGTLDTGPLFVTRQLNKYNGIADSVFDDVNDEDKNKIAEIMIGTGRFNEDDERAVYTPNTHYFNPLIDTAHVAVFKFRCNWFFLLSDFYRRACVELEHKGLYRDPEFAFTLHHWHHTRVLDYIQLLEMFYYGKTCMEISDIIPSVQIFSNYIY